MNSPAPQRNPSDHLDLVQLVASEVPADLPYIRFHVAKLFVSLLLLRLGLNSDQVVGFFPEVDIARLSLEYAALLDGERMSVWFAEALDRFEPVVRCHLARFSDELATA